MLETFNISQTVFTFLVVIYSIILHEVAHGYAAYIQGDETALRAGRLTLNPLPHIDPVGSVIIPLLAFLGFGTFFGWARPVPYNPHNIRSRLGNAFVAAAGVLTNILLAVLVAIAYVTLLHSGHINQAISSALLLVISVNLSLAFFNLIPVPPFDGMSILESLFPKIRFPAALIYNPIYMLVAIYVASVLYGHFMPSIMNSVLSAMGF
jgi:Zn-dependent protease